MAYRYRPPRRSPLRGLIVLVVVLIVAARLVAIGWPHLREALAGTFFAETPAALPPPSCRGGNPLSGVYNPGRLAMRGRCVSVVGRVVFVLHAPDGDMHVSLLPDRGYWHLLDRRNYAAQGGTMVVEVVPADQGTVRIPNVGARVRVTGAYVTDLEHGWREIHPTWQITPVSD